MTNFKLIDKKWQESWEKKKIFQVNELKKKKFYSLEMFAYPSGSGLHMGHAFNYTVGDIFARFKIMNGFNVLHPVGYDSFGLPAENAAIKANIHPKKYTESAIENFVKQQKRLGLSYDWSRLFKTSSSEYYKWNQYLFLKLYEAGLVYRKKSCVNWCPKCETVLANEQVHDGKCWRHSDCDVVEKELEQWFIKTSKYSQELLDYLPKLQWPERIKFMQENWIGKSKGAKVKFKLKDSNEEIEVFTTRPDTLYGVTFLVYSIQHPKVRWLTKDTMQSDEVEYFLRNLPKQSPEDRDKEGIFIGRYAINPLTNEEVPIYASNFVVPDYATGVVMAVPAHDQRDFEFAKKYGIPIKLVIQPKKGLLNVKEMESAYTGPGILVNSGKFSSLDNETAKEEIIKFLKSNKLGKEELQYRLRDWLVSRQRYWGTPIPMIYCEKCGIVPVPEKDLPIKLPEKIIFGKGNPLETSNEFIQVRCPKCKSLAKRETDTMDTFFDSSWYFLRFTDSHNKLKPFETKKVDFWLPVDMYIGGSEHACMHLIYARFFTKALRDLGMLELDEPFKVLYNQGMIHGEDGFVMSKSRGNVVDPIKTLDKYGADALRIFLVSNASPDKDSSWSATGIESSYKLVSKIYNYVKKAKVGITSARVENKLNKTIKEVTEDLENLRYNLALIKIRELVDSFEKQISKKDLESFVKLICPFAPHIAEELWNLIGNKKFVSLETWPKFDSKKINPELDAIDELIQNTIKDVYNIQKLVSIKPTKIVISVAEHWKYNLINDIKKEMKHTYDISEIIKAVIDKEHAQDIAKLVPSFVKNPTKLPKLVLSQEKEFNSLKENKKRFEKEFNLAIEITKNNIKAMPGKPAILFE
ncbi:leucine--tRNA ligase [Candidatus Woesearchaeota archaeon]|nr:leucine--tRNA ligase [Candidatus Woesearchaeota archaeon]